MRNLKEEVADTIVDNKADIFTISTELRNISKNVQVSLSEEFNRFPRLLAFIISFFHLTN